MILEIVTWGFFSAWGWFGANYLKDQWFPPNPPQAETAQTNSKKVDNK
jgi:hypothetical protein